MIKKLTAEEVYRKCNPNIFNAESTAQINACYGIIGQERVKEAFALAVGVKNSFYNVFALGSGGIGRKRFIRNFLEGIETPSGKPLKEYCYVYNFKKPEEPIYLEFNQGEVLVFKHQINEFIEELKVTIPSALESDSYQNKINQIAQKQLKKQEEALSKIKFIAEENNVNVLKTPQGFVIVALDPKTKQPLQKEQIDSLSPKEKKEIEEKIQKLQFQVEDLINDIPALEKEKQEKLKEIKAQAIKRIINPKINSLLKKWSKNNKTIEYIKSINNEIINNSSFFYEESSENKMPNPFSSLMAISKPKGNSNIFEVNVIVSYEKATDKDKAPIIFLENPTYSNLFGKIEYTAQFGAYSTDLTLIKGGSLHLANSGYLVVNARPLLEAPILWYQLKKIIKTSSLPINLDNSLGTNIVTLDPEPIPFNGKIILLGEPDIYNALWQLDPEFKELFKITAEFNDVVPYNEASAKTYAEVAASIIQKENLKPLNKEALAKLVEIGAREAGGQSHLTANVSLLIDIIREANYVAAKNNLSEVSSKELDNAYRFRKERLSRIPSFIKDRIKDKTIIVETEGSTVGQINGLSIISINEFMFGQPQRISCSVFQGDKGIIDVERSVNLAGAIYSKGVMIISAFMHNRFSRDNILSFSSTLNFEQSYGKVDGDSASAAATFALLSALSNTPLKQNFAVTGSMDQKGRVQAIGGVNDKIEGFFAICKARGLNKTHAVIIPEANVKDLMLDQEVINAINEGLFSIYAISHVDEGIEILTGIKAGVKNSNGKFPSNTINGIIQKLWTKKAPK